MSSKGRRNLGLKVRYHPSPCTGDSCKVRPSGESWVSVDLHGEEEHSQGKKIEFKILILQSSY